MADTLGGFAEELEQVLPGEFESAVKKLLQRELAFRFSLADYKENEIIKDIPLYDMPIVKFYGETCSCWI